MKCPQVSPGTSTVPLHTYPWPQEAAGGTALNGSGNQRLTEAPVPPSDTNRCCTWPTGAAGSPHGPQMLTCICPYYQACHAAPAQAHPVWKGELMTRSSATQSHSKPSPPQRTAFQLSTKPTGPATQTTGCPQASPVWITAKEARWNLHCYTHWEQTTVANPAGTSPGESLPTRATFQKLTEAIHLPDVQISTGT